MPVAGTLAGADERPAGTVDAMDDDGKLVGTDGHDDYFVTVDAQAVSRAGDWDPGQHASRRRLGIVLVLGLAMVVALSVTAVLVRAAGPGAASGASAAQRAPLDLVEDGFRLWATNGDGTPVRWNPCEPIRWVLNAEGAPLGAQDDIEAAFASVAAISGLEFEFRGRTNERPDEDRLPYQPDRYGTDVWAPVLVSWAAPAPGVPLGERDRAVAIPIAIGDGEVTTFVSGQIVFNRERDLQRGFADRGSSLGSTTMHEVGHLVGLDHVSDPDQLMFPHPHLGPVQWGDGDRRGLRVVGSELGCVEPVAPHPVEVSYVPDFGD